MTQASMQQRQQPDLRYHHEARWLLPPRKVCLVWAAYSRRAFARHHMQPPEAAQGSTCFARILTSRPLKVAQAPCETFAGALLSRGRLQPARRQGYARQRMRILLLGSCRFCSLALAPGKLCSSLAPPPKPMLYLRSK